MSRPVVVTGGLRSAEAVNTAQPSESVAATKTYSRAVLKLQVRVRTTELFVNSVRCARYETKRTLGGLALSGQAG